ncbi:hypothetical protein F2P56_020583, partial [Juglans regia]
RSRNSTTKTQPHFPCHPIAIFRLDKEVEIVEALRPYSLESLACRTGPPRPSKSHFPAQPSPPRPPPCDHEHSRKSLYNPSRALSRLLRRNPLQTHDLSVETTLLPPSLPSLCHSRPLNSA